MQRSDVVVIGGGPAGLYAAYCCGMESLSCIVLESLELPGGQCAAYYGDREIYGVPTAVRMNGKEIVGKLVEQALGFSTTEIMYGVCAHDFKKVDDWFVVNDEFAANFVIFASGAGSMKPNVPNSIIGTDRVDGFVQCYCSNVDAYKNKNVVVAGGGDSAADCAINISRIASSVTLIHRRDRLTCQQCKINAVQKVDNIKLMLDTKIQDVSGSKKVITDKGEVVDVDNVIFCYGFASEQCVINGLDLFDNGLVHVNPITMQSHVENVFAIGDVALYEKKKKGLLSGFSDANRAVQAIISK